MLSADRISHLSHLLMGVLEDEDAFDEKYHAQVFKLVKISMDTICKKLIIATERAEKKVMETKKNLIPGTHEYFASLERVFLDEVHKI